MRTAAIIPVLNQFVITEQSLKFLSQDDPRPFELIVLDNDSEFEFTTQMPGVKVVRNETRYGPYQSFWSGLSNTDAEFLAFFHSDVFVYEKDWWKRVEEEFDKNPKLGLIGFVGSNEIDQAGGRGLGTASNFQGRSTTANITPIQDIDVLHPVEDQVEMKTWTGSPAEVHGKRITGIMKAAVVDGCVMILRRSVLEQIPFRENFPPHHFYDRLLSTEVLERGFEVAVLGIEFDHISGQTANQESAYHNMAKEWATKHHITPGGIGTNWDSVIYQEAERQWLSEYRDQKHIVPIKV